MSQHQSLDQSELSFSCDSPVLSDNGPTDQSRIGASLFKSQKYKKQDQSEKESKLFLKKSQTFDGNKCDIVVGDRLIKPFNSDDPLFDLREPVPPSVTKSTQCHVCSIHLKSKSKNCQFCGLLGCSNCVYKKYPFPKSNQASGKKKGIICLTCETKLDINAITAGLVRGIRKKEKLADQLESELESSRRQTQQEEQKLQVAEDNLKFQQDDHLHKVSLLEQKINSQKSKIEQAEQSNSDLVNQIQQTQVSRVETEDQLLQSKERLQSITKQIAEVEAELKCKREDMALIQKQIQVNKRKQPSQSSNRSSIYSNLSRFSSVNSRSHRDSQQGSHISNTSSVSRGKSVVDMRQWEDLNADYKSKGLPTKPREKGPVQLENKSCCERCVIF